MLQSNTGNRIIRLSHRNQPPDRAGLCSEGGRVKIRLFRSLTILKRQGDSATLPIARAVGAEETGDELLAADGPR